MEQVGKTALLFGATGAVGREVLHLLINDHRYDRIIVFSRKVIPIEHPKLEIILDALSDLDKISHKIEGDELFCCIGTTSRKAGSREAFMKVDLDIPVNLARIANENGVDGFIVISSIGAGSRKTGFYLGVKTEMEEKVAQYDFKKFAIVRPSLLISNRDEFRFAEETGKVLNNLLGWAMKGKMEKYKGIRTDDVARAMISIMNMDRPKRIWESDELQQISNREA